MVVWRPHGVRPHRRRHLLPARQRRRAQAHAINDQRTCIGVIISGIKRTEDTSKIVNSSRISNLASKLGAFLSCISRNSRFQCFSSGGPFWVATLGKALKMSIYSKIAP